MKLVIVESPNKKKTIQKYLNQISQTTNEEYNVQASVGHIRDLVIDGKYNMGVNEDSGNFEPNYGILPGKEKVVDKLVKLASESDEVFLATDPDREGEAIAWHLCNVLNIDPLKANRLEFHEITRYAIQDSLNNVRHINIDLFHAQESRRIIDRLLGFKMSYVINRDINSKSAGRVQSPVLNFLYERDKEIKNFVSTPYYHIYASLSDASGVEFRIPLVDNEHNLVKFETKEELDETLKKLSKNLILKSIEKADKETKSAPPYTLSKLQQACSMALKYKVALTNECVKKLFEDGYVTYPRTDSIRMAPEFINKVKTNIKENYGDEYVGVAKVQGSKSQIQDAHECLRPTDLAITPDNILEIYAKDKQVKKIAKVYEMIFNAAIKSVMKPRIDEVTTYSFDNNGYAFEYEASENKFLGFSVVDKKKEQKPVFFDGNVNDVFKAGLEVDEKQTKAPYPYTEGQIVKKMEETGIGRPSTYESTIATLIKQRYATSKTYLEITDIGIKTIEYLNKHFDDTIDVEYTSKMESQLDEIAEAKLNELDFLKESYQNFMVEFNEVLHNPDKQAPETIGENCPVCGSPLIVIHGKNNDFIGCSNYPNCHYIKPEYVGRDCPECGKPLIYKVSKSGRFIACSGFPNCKHTEFIQNKKFFPRKKAK